MTEKSLSYHKIVMVDIVHMFTARKILATNVIDTSGDVIHHYTMHVGCCLYLIPGQCTLIDHDRITLHIIH